MHLKNKQAALCLPQVNKSFYKRTTEQFACFALTFAIALELQL